MKGDTMARHLIRAALCVLVLAGARPALADDIDPPVARALEWRDVDDDQAPGPSASARLFELAYTAAEWNVLIGHAWDAAATQRCLGSGRCVELNPWLARFNEPIAFTAAKTSIAVAQLWAMRKLRDSGHPRLALAANVAIGVGFEVIAIRNQRIGQR